MKLVVATCQFPVDRDVARNEAFVERQMREARRRGAHVAHFSEGCLSGYAEREFESFADFDWEKLAGATRRIMELAKKLGLWVILGSAHRLTGSHKPHNSVYVISDRGRIVDRYDKVFCTGDTSESREDLRHYSPGDHLVTFAIRGVRCGILICHDFRYPELFREYKRRGVEVIFHSFHNGHARKAALRGTRNIWGIMTPTTTQANAASNYLWISASNTSRRESCWPGFFIRPDGVITGRLRMHQASVLISTVDSRAKFFDASAAWRERAMKGIYHSGTLVRDKRSRCRTGL